MMTARRQTLIMWRIFYHDQHCSVTRFKPYSIAKRRGVRKCRFVYSKPKGSFSWELGASQIRTIIFTSGQRPVRTGIEEEGWMKKTFVDTGPPLIRCFSLVRQMEIT